jgi:hypothetical protein
VQYVDGLKYLGKPVPFVYFYFKHNDPTKATFRSLLVSILDQMAIADDAILGCVFQELTSSSNGLLDTTSSRIEDVVKVVLRNQLACFIILDGLDEISDCDTVIRFFRELISNPPTSDFENVCSFRLLFSGQRDGILDTVLQSFPGISELQIDDCLGHTRDIYSYSRRESARIQKRFKLSDDETEVITERTVREAKGGFRNRGQFDNQRALANI